MVSRTATNPVQLANAWQEPHRRSSPESALKPFYFSSWRATRSASPCFFTDLHATPCSVWHAQSPVNKISCRIKLCESHFLTPLSNRLSRKGHWDDVQSREHVKAHVLEAEGKMACAYMLPVSCCPPLFSNVNRLHSNRCSKADLQIPLSHRKIYPEQNWGSSEDVYFKVMNSSRTCQAKSQHCDKGTCLRWHLSTGSLDETSAPSMKYPLFDYCSSTKKI